MDPKRVVSVLFVLLCLNSWQADAGTCQLMLSLKTETVAPIKIGSLTIERVRLLGDNDFNIVIWKNVPRLQPQGKAVLDAVIHAGSITGKSIDGGNPSMNCHAYALRESGLLLIEPNYWIEGTTSEFSLNTNPLSNVLSGLYKLKAAYSVHEEVSTGLPGDFITLVDKNGTFVHSGILESVDGQIWMKSKMGEHGIVAAPIENYLRVFSVTEIQIYRLK